MSALNQQRSLLPGGYFTNLSQIFAVPQFSIASPFINTNLPNALTDAAYEVLPEQLLPLLRTDSIGQVMIGATKTQLQFTGYDGYAYDVQGSDDLQDWTSLGAQYPTNGSFIFTDPSVTNSNRRFYRTALLP